MLALLFLLDGERISEIPAKRRPFLNGGVSFQFGLLPTTVHTTSNPFGETETAFWEINTARSAWIRCSTRRQVDEKARPVDPAVVAV